jgi:hypothetical protein
LLMTRSRFAASFIKFWTAAALSFPGHPVTFGRGNAVFEKPSSKRNSRLKNCAY